MRFKFVSRFSVIPLMILVPACSDKKGEPGPIAEEHATESPDPTGVWTIVAHRIPGVSAKTEEEATAWHGRVIAYAQGHVSSNGDTCQAATYGFETRPAGRFLGEAYHIAPFTLGIEKETIDVMWVGCGGNPWTEPGGVLIWTDGDHAFAPWDGVFFELVRGATPPPDPNLVTGAGMIVHMDLEGGFFAIQSDDGTTYDPQALPVEFQTDSLRVTFLLRILPDAMGIHQVGPIVEVVEMSRAE